MITNKIYNEDCLEALKRVPDKSVDCIITDPPYFLGMTHNGQKGSFKDLSICKPFYRDLFLEFNRVKKPGACVYFFTDRVIITPLYTNLFCFIAERVFLSVPQT